MTAKEEIALVAGQMADLTRTVRRWRRRSGRRERADSQQGALTSSESEPKYNKNALTSQREN